MTRSLAAAVAGLVLLATEGCHSPRATSGPEPLASSSPPRPEASVHLAASPTSVAVPTVHPLLGDPRLARARELADSRDWLPAAQAFTAAEQSLVPDPRTPLERCAWAYVAGRLYFSAGDMNEAARGFDRAGGAGPAEDGGFTCPLASYATIHAAEAYLKAGDYPGAEARARRVPESSAARDVAQLVLAGALAGEHQLGEAIAIWRAALAKNPKGWIDVALPLASALLDASTSDADAATSLELTTRVVVEAPRIADSSGAEALRQRAWAKVVQKDAKAPRELTLSQRARQARAWLDVGEVTKAAGLSTRLVVDVVAAKDAALLCSVSITRAQALGRTKASSADAWADAVARCEHDDAQVTALYSGAKAVAGKHPDLAIARYAKVEQLFPKHRLADDARFQGALLTLGLGDDARFTKMMLDLPDDYPDGDQRTEALFRVAMLRMQHGEWDGAGTLLDRIIQLTPDDQHWATAGRAEYFRARVAAHGGHLRDADDQYSALIVRHPLSYYMAQAYGRLWEHDPALATRALSKAVASEGDAPLLTVQHPELSSAAADSAWALLAVGDIELARRELAVSGALRDDVSPEVTWALARVYDQAGAVDLGHSLARQKVRDYLAHYPAGTWKTKWEIAYPRAFPALVVKSSHETHIPTALTWAIMREESDFVPDAKSSANAFGLMQLIIPTAKGVAHGTGLTVDEASLKQPAVSVALGTKLLAELRGTFAGNPPLAIAAYNGGGGAVSRWLTARGGEEFDLWVEEIPWDETRGYIKRVLSSEAAYAYLYEPASLDEVLRMATRARGTGAVPLLADGGALP